MRLDGFVLLRDTAQLPERTTRVKAHRHRFNPRCHIVRKGAAFHLNAFTTTHAKTDRGDAVTLRVALKAS